MGTFWEEGIFISFSVSRSKGVDILGVMSEGGTDDPVAESRVHVYSNKSKSSSDLCSV